MLGYTGKAFYPLLADVRRFLAVTVVDSMLRPGRSVRISLPSGRANTIRLLGRSTMIRKLRLRSSMVFALSPFAHAARLYVGAAARRSERVVRRCLLAKAHMNNASADALHLQRTSIHRERQRRGGLGRLSSTQSWVGETLAVRRRDTPASASAAFSRIATEPRSFPGHALTFFLISEMGCCSVIAFSCYALSPWHAVFKPKSL